MAGTGGRWYRSWGPARIFIPPMKRGLKLDRHFQYEKGEEHDEISFGKKIGWGAYDLLTIENKYKYIRNII
jgi:hypothetical protein